MTTRRQAYTQEHEHVREYVREYVFAGECMCVVVREWAGGSLPDPGMPQVDCPRGIHDQGVLNMLGFSSCAEHMGEPVSPSLQHGSMKQMQIQTSDIETE